MSADFICIFSQIETYLPCTFQALFSKLYRLSPLCSMRSSSSRQTSKYGAWSRVVLLEFEQCLHMRNNLKNFQTWAVTGQGSFLLFRTWWEKLFRILLLNTQPRTVKMSFREVWWTIQVWMLLISTQIVYAFCYAFRFLVALQELFMSSLRFWLKLRKESFLKASCEFLSNYLYGDKNLGSLSLARWSLQFFQNLSPGAGTFPF